MVVCLKTSHRDTCRCGQINTTNHQLPDRKFVHTIPKPIHTHIFIYVYPNRIQIDGLVSLKKVSLSICRRRSLRSPVSSRPLLGGSSPRLPSSCGPPSRRLGVIGDPDREGVGSSGGGGGGGGGS